MNSIIVAVGIDSLNIGFNVNKWLVGESDFKRLEDGKKQAGDKLFGGKGVTVEWGGHEFNLIAKGTRGYEYVMFNEDIRMYLAKDCQGGRIYPEAFIQMNSPFLWGEGYDRAYGKLKSWMTEWAAVVSEKINRVDMCVELADKLPKLDVARDVVTGGKKRVDYIQIEQYSCGRKDTGYRFGSSPIMSRLYNKGDEIKKSEKEWFQDIWKSNGWNGESEITRAEFQVRRPCLKEYAVNSYEDLVQTMPDMWHYLSGKWMVIKEPNEKDSNHKRWQTSQLWKAVQDAGYHFGECLGVQRWKQKQARIEPLMAQMKGIIASEVALDSKIRGEYFAIGRIRSEINKYLESEEFRIKVLERRGLYGGLSN